MRRERVVVALGGNALLRRGERAELDVQKAHVLEAAAALAAAAARHDLVLTHGNGPQVGLLALEAEAYRDVRAYPLDVLVAESQGLIGYLLTQALQNELPHRRIVTVVTQIVVDPTDPAFAAPSKPIGPLYSEAEARRLAAERGWTVAPDGTSFRRVVPSPQPRRIVEIDTIERLIAGGAIVVCAGGGGIPVVAALDGLHGVEGVIDKDASAALLAEVVNADRLVLATDVPYVESGYGTPAAATIDVATPRDLRTMRFAPGSMAPKVEAACSFVERTGREAVIGALPDLERLVTGAGGTLVAPHRHSAAHT